ncbi:MAG: NUDIX domain-containing protein [Anaerolineales bacterium]|nr:NUDIX domain-containing protein [Anaerolineales bacterium]
MTHKVLHTETTFTGEVFNVRIDHIESVSGQARRVDVVEHSGAVALIPLDNQGRIILVRQYRHPAGEPLLEIPAGTLEAHEDPEACAVRESREEIGMSPGKMQYLGGTFVAPGYSTEFIHYYLIQDLTPAPLSPDEDEELSVEMISWGEVHRRIRAMEIRDAKSLAGLLLAGIFLGKIDWPEE